MNRVAKGSVRGYRSDLRAHQAEQTRSQILDATLRVMADGVASLSVPAVAREAGVSVPTVYRHFGTKGDLLAALYPYLARRVGLDLAAAAPRTLAELRDGVREMFGHLDTFDDLARAAIASPAAEEARRTSMSDRLELARRLVATIDPRLARADRERIARLLVVLITSSSLRVWRDHLGATVEQAADDIDWIVRAGVAAATGDRP
ncbi:MAG: TetR/AcrR family transcriptional regulator [Actinomycetota bacterium]